MPSNVQSRIDRLEKAHGAQSWRAVDEATTAQLIEFLLDSFPDPYDVVRADRDWFPVIEADAHEFPIAGLNDPVDVYVAGLLRQLMKDGSSHLLQCYCGRFPEFLFKAAGGEHAQS